MNWNNLLLAILCPIFIYDCIRGGYFIIKGREKDSFVSLIFLIANLYFILKLLGINHAN